MSVRETLSYLKTGHSLRILGIYLKPICHILHFVLSSRRGAKCFARYKWRWWNFAIKWFEKVMDELLKIKVDIVKRTENMAQKVFFLTSSEHNSRLACTENHRWHLARTFALLQWRQRGAMAVFEPQGWNHWWWIHDRAEDVGRVLKWPVVMATWVHCSLCERLPSKLERLCRTISFVAGQTKLLSYSVQTLPNHHSFFRMDDHQWAIYTSRQMLCVENNFQLS